MSESRPNREEIVRRLHPQRHGGKATVFANPGTVRLKHRVSPAAHTVRPESSPAVVVPEQGQMSSYGLYTAGEGCSQGPSDVSGLHALDGSPRQQYLRRCSHLAVEN